MKNKEINKKQKLRLWGVQLSSAEAGREPLVSGRNQRIQSITDDGNANKDPVC